MGEETGAVEGHDGAGRQALEDFHQAGALGADFDDVLDRLAVRDDIDDLAGGPEHDALLRHQDGLLAPGVTTTAALTVPPGRRPAVFSMSTRTSRARPVSDTPGLISLTVPLNSLPGSSGEERMTAWPFFSLGRGGFGKGQVGAQALAGDQLQERIADLDVVADGGDLRFHHAVEGRDDARLALVAPALLAAGAGGGELLAQGVALGARIVRGVLRNEALLHQLLLPLDDALLLRQEGFGAFAIRFVGAMLEGDIGIVDDRQEIAFPDGLAGAGQRS